MKKLEGLQWVMNTKVGRLHLVASDIGLVGIHWKKQSVLMAESLTGLFPEAAVLRQTVRELEEYFGGKRKIFSVPLAAQGTAFQKQVWQELSKIPYGSTCSYQQIAARIQNPKAVRAVGSANGKNPLSIIVPCHRVIASDGTLGGYAGGLGIKTRLLEIEGVVGRAGISAFSVPRHLRL